MQDFRRLEVWQESTDLAVAVFRLVQTLRGEDRVSLGTQMRRSAVSVASNIAEGAGRSSSGEFARFLDFSIGSANELETQLELVNRLGRVDATELQERVRLLRRRIISLRAVVTRDS